MRDPGSNQRWNCAAEWIWDVHSLQRLRTPVVARGMQSPFARAKLDTIERVIRMNGELRDVLR
jgi:hypothetical protein